MDTHEIDLALVISDHESRKQLQQQLLLLFHAHRCQMRESSSTRPISCQLPNCQRMKYVLNHIRGCHIGILCQVPNCCSSQQMISHWKKCHTLKQFCSVCKLVTDTFDLWIQQEGPLMQAGAVTNGYKPLKDFSAFVSEIALAPNINIENVSQEQLAMPEENSVTSAAIEKCQLVQKQLITLLHASKCKQSEAKSLGELRQCLLPYCQMMKDVLSHMTTCYMGKACTAPHCSASRMIIYHWKNCTRNDCSVCSPLKVSGLYASSVSLFGQKLGFQGDLVVSQLSVPCMSLEQEKLVQQRLVLLMHAYKCLEFAKKVGQSVRRCAVPECETMQNVLAHMATCHVGNLCLTPYCVSSRYVISHFKSCSKIACRICKPVKQSLEGQHPQVDG